jgi:hypothetical protein
MLCDMHTLLHFFFAYVRASLYLYIITLARLAKMPGPPQYQGKYCVSARLRKTEVRVHACLHDRRCLWM